MLVVAALGGNALLRRGETPDIDLERHNVKTAVPALAQIASEHQLVITHGNGPQVGLLALQGESVPGVRPYPLDVLDAATEGMIGYLVGQELSNALPDRQVATLLTRVVVDSGDPAFAHPTKPIGSVYERADAERLARERGWTIAPDGTRFRRVVASPEPQAIVELDTIRLLVDAGRLVICSGGGGVPVVVDRDGSARGIEAVVDKDLAATLLARGLAADVLLLLTDVAAVSSNWGRADQRPIRDITSSELRKMTFAAGSMEPKVEAACRFVETTGGRAGIGALGDAAMLVEGRAGTLVRRG